ncbi:MAG TPA: hypothetical protein DEF03_02575 [Bacteroidetes bacterium]|nr:hypothetical protein [Bacteroidota bacterium]
MVFDLLDAEALAAYALQDTFDVISVEDREEFVDLFAAIFPDKPLPILISIGRRYPMIRWLLPRPTNCAPR